MTDWTTARVTPEKLAELRRLLDAPPQHITIVRDDALALLDAAAERDRLAGAWDEGHQAGHEDARAVQSTYPEPTPNPYRAEGETHE